MKITVLGAGAWGTALASHAAGSHDVVLWARDAAQAQAMAQERVNRPYLPGIVLPQRLQIQSNLASAVAHVADDATGGFFVVATPMGALRQTLRLLPARAPVLWLCKGFEAETGALGHEIARAERPGSPAGVLSGPSFALEVARGQPTALVVASEDVDLLDKAVSAFHGETLRIYRSPDPVGVEVGGAVKNVLAIATGILDGLAERAGPLAASTATHVPGLNARAALITRGLAEMTRLGVALGAQAKTFMGLSGLGDLVLTATGALSRNRQVGLGLAAGLPLDRVLAQLGHVAEGVYSAQTVLMRAGQVGVDMPITQAVADVLAQRLTPMQAVSRLMARESTSEG